MFPGIESAVPTIDSPFELVAAVTGKKLCVNAETGQQAVLSNELHVLSVSRQTQFGWFSQNQRLGNTVRQPPAHFENVLRDCPMGFGIDDEVMIHNRGWHAVAG